MAEKHSFLSSNARPEQDRTEKGNERGALKRGWGDEIARLDVPKVKGVEPLQRMRGGSQPRLIRCSDGELYVTKSQNNPQGVRILANELLGTLLARALGLALPDFAIVDVPGELIAGSEVMRIELGRGVIPCKPGLCFGSRYPQSVLDFPTEEHLSRVENSTDFIGMLVLDKWTGNVDSRQIVLVPQFNGSPYYSYRALMIDQGFCFNGASWDFPDAPKRGLYPRPFVYSKIMGVSAFEPWLERLERRLDLQFLKGAASQIPPEWYEQDTGPLSRLIAQLDYRRHRARELLLSTHTSMKHFFVEWHVDPSPPRFAANSAGQP